MKVWRRMVHLIWRLAKCPVHLERGMCGELRGGRFSYQTKCKEDMFGRKNGQGHTSLASSWQEQEFGSLEKVLLLM